ncbi:MAG: M23 family metallopeptidase [Flavobacteriaceae bacterium]
MKNLYIILFLINYSIVFSQVKVEEANPPVNIPIKLSGNFGELRSSGFHSGIDIKTLGKEGVEIKSIDDGYVSRISISLSGFGKAIYITHPNGFTSVYAHLSRFNDDIEKLTQAFQYEKKSFVINKFFKKNEINIRKNDIIGFSGNTGSSFGPHLHFEIRKSSENLPINPLRFGYPIDDTIPPSLRGLFLYKIDDKPNKRKKINIKKISANEFLGETIKANGSFGFGVISSDRQNKSYNINGTYNYKVIKNDTTEFEIEFDNFSFNEKTYQMKFMDYGYYIDKRSRLIKIFNENNLNANFIKSNSSGIINVNENDSIKIKIILSDYLNNKTQVNLNFFGGKDSLEFYFDDFSNFNSFINKSEDFSFSKNGAYVKIKKNTFNSDTFLDIKYLKDTLHLINPKVYAFKAIEISIPQKVKNKKQSYVAYMDDKGKKAFATIINIDSKFKFKTNNLGKFYVDIDSIPPNIKSINRKNKISFEIKDDETGIKKYDVFVNGNWHLFEYEPKRNEIFCDPNSINIYGKEVELEVIVEDLVGNKKTLIKKLAL